MDWDKKGGRGKPRVQMPTYGNLDELAYVESSLEAFSSDQALYFSSPAQYH